MDFGEQVAKPLVIGLNSEPRKHPLPAFYTNHQHQGGKVGSEVRQKVAQRWRNRPRFRFSDVDHMTTVGQSERGIHPNCDVILMPSNYKTSVRALTLDESSQTTKMPVISKSTSPIPCLAHLPGSIPEEEDNPVVNVNERVIDNDVEVPLSQSENFSNMDHIPKDDPDKGPINSNSNTNAQGNDQQTELRSTMLEILNSPEVVDEEPIPPELSISYSASSSIGQVSLDGGTDSSIAQSVPILSPTPTAERVFNNKTPFFTRMAHCVSHVFLACIGKKKMPKKVQDESDSEDSEDIMDYCYTKEYIMSVQKRSAVDTISTNSIQSRESDWDVSSLDFENIQHRIEDIPSSQLSYGDLSIFTDDSGTTLDSRVEPPKKKSPFRKAIRRISRFFKG